MAGGSSASAGSRRALAAALLCCVALAAAHAQHKRQHMSPAPAPFTLAARYGRAAAAVAPRLAPRDHGWMLTTRYGKRSPPFMEGYSPTPETPPAVREGPRATYEGRGGGRALSCVYTGVLALYRCARAQAPSLAARRRTDPVLASEEE